MEYDLGLLFFFPPVAIVMRNDSWVIAKKVEKNTANKQPLCNILETEL